MGVTRFFGSFKWKISRGNGTSEQVVLFPGRNVLNGNSCSISSKPSFIGGQRGRVVSASDLQSGGPGFESRSGHLLDLFSIVPSSNPRPRL